MKNVLRIIMIGLIVFLVYGCGPKRVDKRALLDVPVLDEATQVRVIKEILEIDGEKRKLVPIGEVTEVYEKKHYAKEKYLFRSETDFTPVEIPAIVRGCFVKNDNELLVSVKVKNLSHVAGFQNVVYAVYNKEMKGIISERRTLYLGEATIIRGNMRDYILDNAGDCHVGVCNWEVSLLSYSKQGKLQGKKLFSGNFTDGEESSNRYYKESYGNAPMVPPPKVSETKIVFSDRKYIWNPDKEEFERVAKK